MTKSESKVLRENYITIQGFMITDLKLKGNELLIYAIIYGFSQAENQVFSGSLQYLMEWTNSTKQSVIKCLKSLVEKGYIARNEKIINNVKFCEYSAIRLIDGVVNKVYYPSTKFNEGGKQSLTGVVNKVYSGGKQSLPNNINNNINDNNKNIKESKKVTFDAIISDYAKGNEETTDLLQEWLKVRKAKRAAMTDRAIKMNIDKLDSLAKQSGMSVPAYLQEVICRGWAAFYPINSYGNSKPAAKVGVNGIALSDTPSELDDVF